MNTVIIFREDIDHLKNLENAMKIENQDEANQFMRDYISYLLRIDSKLDLDSAKKTVRDNLGYYAGYYDREVGERIERLFKCEHPILGPVKIRYNLTAQEIFNIGYERGKQLIR